jgi:hypothetical protein
MGRPFLFRPWRRFNQKPRGRDPCRDWKRRPERQFVENIADEAVAREPVSAPKIPANRAALGFRAPAQTTSSKASGGFHASRSTVSARTDDGIWTSSKSSSKTLFFGDAPIEITGFTLDEIDQIVLDDQQTAIEAGPLAPNAAALSARREGASLTVHAAPLTSPPRARFC